MIFQRKTYAFWSRNCACSHCLSVPIMVIRRSVSPGLSLSIVISVFVADLMLSNRFPFVPIMLPASGEITFKFKFYFIYM